MAAWWRRFSWYILRSAASTARSVRSCLLASMLRPKDMLISQGPRLICERSLRAASMQARARGSSVLGSRATNSSPPMRKIRASAGMALRSTTAALRM